MAKNYQTNEVYNNQIGINVYEYYDNSAKNSFLGDKVFAQIRSVDEQKLIAQLSEESKRQRKLKKYLIIDIVAIVLILAIMLLLGLDIKFLSIFIPLAVVAALINILIIIIKNNKNSRNYLDYTEDECKNYILKKAVGDKVEELVYDSHYGLESDIYKDLNIIKSGNRYNTEDFISGKYNGVYFAQADLRVKLEGGNDNTVEYFNGRWIAIDYPKKFSGTVSIIDNSFKYSVKRNDLEKIQLENSTFNNMFKVKASNMQLGYYLLTPQLVERFIELKQKSNGKVIACFKDVFLHIFINNRKDSFELNIDNFNITTEVQRFLQDFELVNGTIDVLEVGNSFYVQSETQPSQYQNHSDDTPQQTKNLGVGIQGGRF